MRVTLYEREADLGGRLAGRPVRLADGSTATMSRGFHAFFPQYYNLRGLLRRADPGLDMLRRLPDYPLRHRAGWQDSFARVPRTPPWSALGFVALSPTFTWRDLARMRPGAALPLLDVRVPQVYERLDGISAQDFLSRIRFPEAARHLAFEVFSRSFFADPRELSAAELVLMFHIYFLGSSEGLLFDVPAEPFPQALWHPLGRYLTGHGVRLCTDTAVTRVGPAAGGGVQVVARGEARRFDAVVLALDPGGLRKLVAASDGLADAAWRARIGRLRTAPPFLVSRLWLERQVRADRPGFLGTSGYGSLDNVSVLERWEGRRPAGRPAPAARCWNCMPTPSPRKRTGRANSVVWWSSCTPSTRRPAVSGSSTGGTSGARTARCSRWAASATGRPCTRPTPGWWSRAMRYAPGSRWR